MRFAMLLPVVHARQSTAAAEDSLPVKSSTGPVLPRRQRKSTLFRSGEEPQTAPGSRSAR